MPRRKLSRTIEAQAPDERTASKSLLSLTSRRLYHDPCALPPIASPSLFGNDRPLELEIGCGTGEFLCALAGREPAVNFVRVDLRAKSLHTRLVTSLGAYLGLPRCP